MNSLLTDRRVALIKDQARYCQEPPYHPSEWYPEHSGVEVGCQDNPAYRAVRRALFELGLDSVNFGTAGWNPLGELIQPNQTVVLKPNLVSHRNLGQRAFGLTDTDSLVTHGSVIRVVLDYAAKALNGHGRIIIADCPLQGTSWEEVTKLVNLDGISSYARSAYPQLEVVTKDYRLGKAVMQGSDVLRRVEDKEQLKDYVEVDVADASLLVDLMGSPTAFGVAQYSSRRMVRAHSGNTHLYLFPKDLLFADVMINLPKLKSHMKAGITCALKNLVGINGLKDYLPHFRYGSPKQGGDEYPDGGTLWDLMWKLFHKDWEYDAGLRKRLFAVLGRAVGGARLLVGGSRLDTWLGGGSWHGNDTLWRTVLDINRAFFYFDRSTGAIGDCISPKLRYLNIVDGLVAGDREGPLAPSPVRAGLVLAARNPLAADAVAAAMMGFDYKKIKTVWQGFHLPRLPIAAFGPEEVVICGHPSARDVQGIYSGGLYQRFEASRGFKGQVEYAADE